MAKTKQVMAEGGSSGAFSGSSLGTLALFLAQLTNEAGELIFSPYLIILITGALGMVWQMGINGVFHRLMKGRD